MLNVRFFQKILTPILFPISMLYLAIVNVRNFLYDIGFFKTTKVDGVKIISIGNIKTGGTGKTPLCIGISNYLNTLGFKTAIITNAYKAKQKSTLIVSDGSNIFYKTPIVNDETYMLAKKTHSIIVSTKDRLSAIESLNQFKPEYIIFDDGLQYRKIAKDLEVCIIDSERFYLPFGYLRDSKKSLKRCQKIVCFDGDCEIKSEITIKGFFDINGAFDKPKSVFVFCSIGDPQKFLISIKTLGIKINGFKCFKDHYYYTKKDIELLRSLKHQTGSEVLLTTYKDFVKIEQPGIVYLDIEAKLDYCALLKGVV
ncbi:Tetraacyldisaccharide 4'-kinase [Desulfurella amilsii]|uniref:Tetraacyldisaccharide 4'-kinase n=1 Tax=Desulfurella amilsii TaxID=1562698 RepID=A0A1X4XVN3_9BACT|nr:tetraacyldisaccharide 4'-kinase [Desulfurella amilsii]OSS41591.1 Tetraacyldisaccharide 4'-kinase [Desulfurella amilsii]